MARGTHEPLPDRPGRDPARPVATCHATSFFIFIVRGGEVRTSIGPYCMNGITRRLVLDPCRAHDAPSAERVPSLTDVDDAGEAFVPGTLGGLAPVTRVVDELLHGHDLRVAGAAHPSREEVPATMETDGGRLLRETILGPADAGILFLKNMAHHPPRRPRGRPAAERRPGDPRARPARDALPSPSVQIPEPTGRAPRDPPSAASAAAARRTSDEIATSASGAQRGRHVPGSRPLERSG